MRVVRDHEHAAARDRHAAVDPGRGIARHAVRARTLIVPELTSAAGVEGVAFVAARHIHDAVHDDRRDLETRGAR